MIIDDHHKDMLIEVASIAFGNVSTSLSKLIHHEVKIERPTLHFESIERVSEQFGSPTEQVTAILLQMNGDLKGVMLFLLPVEQAKTLDRMINTNSTNSSLPEIGNILAGTALGAISNFLKLSVIESVPDVCSDMLRAVVVSSILQLGEEVDEVLLLEGKFVIPDISVTARVFFVFEKIATQKIITSLLKHE